MSTKILRTESVRLTITFKDNHLKMSYFISCNTYFLYQVLKNSANFEKNEWLYIVRGKEKGSYLTWRKGYVFEMAGPCLALGLIRVIKLDTNCATEDASFLCG